MLARSKYSSLLLKFVNYRSKFFKYCAQGRLPKDLAFRILVFFLEKYFLRIYLLLKCFILTFGQNEFRLLNSWNLWWWSKSLRLDFPFLNYIFSKIALNKGPWFFECRTLFFGDKVMLSLELWICKNPKLYGSGDKGLV
jgi:hypothetical protein